MTFECVRQKTIEHFPCFQLNLTDIGNKGLMGGLRPSHVTNVNKQDILDEIEAFADSSFEVLAVIIDKVSAIHSMHSITS